MYWQKFFSLIDIIGSIGFAAYNANIMHFCHIFELLILHAARVVNLNVILQVTNSLFIMTTFNFIRPK